VTGVAATGPPAVPLLAAVAFAHFWAPQTVADVDRPNLRVFEQSFDVAAPSEIVAVVHARCSSCWWGVAGREATALRLAVDGRYSQHLLLARGDTEADYPVTLGAVEPGQHRLVVDLDSTLSAPHSFGALVTSVDVRTIVRTENEFLAQSMAPILHARPNTVGRFTDLPILMWYEVQPTPRGRQFRYSVVFTNEDDGTATDRLMATWGRTTDIEFVYGVDVDDAGAVLREEIQGPGHQVPAFNGRHEGRHPLLWVATDNNMVSEAGTTAVRYAPAPEHFDLTKTSREAVMDAHPWSYALMEGEIRREGKIADEAPAGSGRIPDLRRFAFVEACTELENAALAFSVLARDANGARWYDSDRGLPEFRIVRTGCFRGAVPLSPGAGPAEAIRFRAFSRPPQPGVTERPRAAVRLTAVNKLFMLGDDYLPRPSAFNWIGALDLSIDGDWRELRF